MHRVAGDLIGVQLDQLLAGGWTFGGIRTLGHQPRVEQEQPVAPQDGNRWIVGNVDLDLLPRAPDAMRVVAVVVLAMRALGPGDHVHRVVGGRRRFDVVHAARLEPRHFFEPCGKAS